MIGNNSCGTHSVMAGKTVDNIDELDVITYDGARLTAGATSEDKLNRIIAAGGRRGAIYHRCAPTVGASHARTGEKSAEIWVLPFHTRSRCACVGGGLDSKPTRPGSGAADDPSQRMRLAVTDLEHRPSIEELTTPIVLQSAVQRSSRGEWLGRILRTTDHKIIGRMYLVTSLAFFLIAGAMAMLMRIELARPGMQILSLEQYNELFTIHGTVMLLLFATPIAFAFANLVMPLQIGSPDVAFPRLNAFSYWLFLFGGLTVLSGFLTPNGAADFGWFGYSPLTDATNTPGAGADLWILGLIISGLGTILAAVNMVTTIVTPA